MPNLDLFADLLPKHKSLQPRAKSRVLMHVFDAGEREDGEQICVMRCRSCLAQSGWLPFATATVARRGTPCGTCNPTIVTSMIEKVDGLPVECDGATRMISTALQYLAVPHTVCVGQLVVNDLGAIPHHWWIGLADGQVVDVRARMWLGRKKGVPHGLFMPGHKQLYRTLETRPHSAVMFTDSVMVVLGGMSVAELMSGRPVRNQR